MSTSHSQVCFVNTDELPLKVEHICYYTIRNDDKVSLIEVVNETYRHPDEQEDATVSLIKTKNWGDYSCFSKKSAALILLEAAQQNVENIRDLL